MARETKPNFLARRKNYYNEFKGIAYRVFLVRYGARIDVNESNVFEVLKGKADSTAARLNEIDRRMKGMLPGARETDRDYERRIEAGEYVKQLGTLQQQYFEIAETIR